MKSQNQKIDFELIRDSTIKKFIDVYEGQVEIDESVDLIAKDIIHEVKDNEKFRIIVYGPARSGKSILSARLLSVLSSSNLLLMNYLVYTDIINYYKFNNELSFYAYNKVKVLLKEIQTQLSIIINNDFDLEKIKDISGKISKFFSEIDNNHFSDLLTNEMIMVKHLNQNLNDIYFKSYLDNEVSILNLLNEIFNHLPSESYLDIFHSSNNRFRKFSNKVFHHDYKQDNHFNLSNIREDSILIIDECQRLSKNNVERYLNKFNKIIFIGDPNQKINPKFDDGINIIEKTINHRNEKYNIYKLENNKYLPKPMIDAFKYLSDLSKIYTHSKDSRSNDFKIVLINNDINRFNTTFHNYESKEKHFAMPIFYYENAEPIKLLNSSRPLFVDQRFKLELLLDYESTDYFCNEETINKYILTPYYLISRELDGLFIHLPKIHKDVHLNHTFIRFHLYTLFTRTKKLLVINCEDSRVYNNFEKKLKEITVLNKTLKICFYNKHFEELLWQN